MSRAIFRSNTGEMSRPMWNGTVVPRPSGMTELLVQAQKIFRLNKKPRASSRRDPPFFAASAPAAWAWSGHLHFLGTDELRLELGFAILKQHPDDLGQVLVQLIERFPLRNAHPGKPGTSPTNRPSWPGNARSQP